MILAALKAKVSGYSAFDDVSLLFHATALTLGLMQESPITGTKTAPDLEVISFLARECKAELKTDAAVTCIYGAQMTSRLTPERRSCPLQIPNRNWNGITKVFLSAAVVVVIWFEALMTTEVKVMLSPD